MDEFLKLFDDEPAHLHSSCHSYLPSSPLTDGSSAASVISLSIYLHALRDIGPMTTREFKIRGNGPMTTRLTNLQDSGILVQ
uniref:Uncharacterized protein n=1 Tax=Amphimedon queenslandica TaxID=400682 RepID=A0A1X7SF76_AMPQE